MVASTAESVVARMPAVGRGSAVADGLTHQRSKKNNPIDMTSGFITTEASHSPVCDS